MTRIDGLTLTEAEHAIEEAHEGWHVWHSRDGDNTGRIYATSTTVSPRDPDATGTTLDAPDVGRIEEAIGRWEFEQASAA